MQNQEKKQQLSRGQREYFKDSLMKDEKGDLLVFHVAWKEYSDGSYQYIAKGYLDKEDVKTEGGFSVMSMYANVKNPFIYEDKEQIRELAQKEGLQNNEEIVKYLQSQGYDAMIRKEKDAPMENIEGVIIFETNQFKSIDNRFPTADKNFIDNSADYKEKNFRNMTLDEHLELAKKFSKNNPDIQDNGRNRGQVR